MSVAWIALSRDAKSSPEAKILSTHGSDDGDVVVQVSSPTGEVERCWRLVGAKVSVEEAAEVDDSGSKTAAVCCFSVFSRRFVAVSGDRKNLVSWDANLQHVATRALAAIVSDADAGVEKLLPLSHSHNVLVCLSDGSVVAVDANLTGAVANWGAGDASKTVKFAAVLSEGAEDVAKMSDEELKKHKRAIARRRKQSARANASVARPPFEMLVLVTDDGGDEQKHKSTLVDVSNMARVAVLQTIDMTALLGGSGDEDDESEQRQKRKRARKGGKKGKKQTKNTASSSSLLTCAASLDSRSISVVSAQGSWSVVSFPAASSISHRRAFQSTPQVTVSAALSLRNVDSLASCFVSPHGLALVGLQYGAQPDGEDDKRSSQVPLSATLQAIQRQVDNNNNKSDDDDSKELSSTLLTVWDTKFGTVQQAERLPAGFDRVSSDSVAADTAGRRVLVRANDGERHIVSVVTAAAQSGSLLSAIGRLAQSAQFMSTSSAVKMAQPPLLPAFDTNAVWRSSTEASIDSLHEHFDSSIAESHQEEESALAKLVDTTRTKTSKQFHKVFDAFMAKRRRTIRSTRRSHLKRKRSQDSDDDDDDDGDDDEQKRAQQSSSASSWDVSQHFLESVAKRCVASEFWSALDTLVNTNRLSAQSMPELIVRLIECQQTDVIKNVLVHVHDVSEDELVLILQYALDAICDNTVEDEDDSKNDKNKVSSLDHDAESIIHLVLSAPRSDVFLHESLKALTEQQSVVMLRYLHKWLQRYWAHTESFIGRSFRHMRLPSFSQVLEWAMMVVDAHFTRFVLLPECEQIIRDMRHIVCVDHLQLCQGMEGLRGALKHVLKHESVPRPSIGAYSVDYVAL
eukprot:TRINITY_DN67234_c6_g14_i1.p1 TRINITY_DN67234_c6_g14~~TRINITY_DN67234_c6_g14_i1.p1  ORF type:complete len:867 (-),score=416.40 TRINITY_DN67234_c6_g14_i1:50-2614(-)